MAGHPYNQIDQFQRCLLENSGINSETLEPTNKATASLTATNYSGQMQDGQLVNVTVDAYKISGHTPRYNFSVSDNGVTDVKYSEQDFTNPIEILRDQSGHLKTDVDNKHAPDVNLNERAGNTSLLVTKQCKL
jgi:hypothetical protein